jgi:hypothetical protein
MLSDALKYFIRLRMNKKEVAFIILYLSVWLSPIVLSWMVALSGRNFSFVGIKWQLVNSEIIGLYLFLSFIFGVAGAISGVAISKLISGKCNVIRRFSVWEFTRLMWLAVIAISVISALGLFKSHGNIVWKESYSGEHGG